MKPIDLAKLLLIALALGIAAYGFWFVGAMTVRELQAPVASPEAASKARTRRVDPAAADAFRRDLRAAVDQTHASMRSIQAMRAHSLKLDELAARSRRLFGDVFEPTYGACVKAAGLIQGAWGEQIALASNADAVRAGGLGNLAFEAGIEYWACRMAIDALLPPAPAN